MASSMCGIQLKDRKRSTDLIFILDLNETIDQLAMANCSLVWSCVDVSGWSCLEKALDFEVDGQRKKWSLKRKLKR